MHLFLYVLPRFLFMEAPILRAKRERYASSLSMKNTKQSDTFENSMYTINEAIINPKSTSIDKVIS